MDALTGKGRLGSILEKFTDASINLTVKPVKDDDGAVILSGLDNHTMGTMFEELLRRFNEENNVTEAGEHVTPRDYVRLLGRLAVEPVKDALKDGTYTIYDGASGTGGILTVTQEEFDKVAAETGRKIRTLIFGQELQSATYATCKADMMISGNVRKFTYRLGSADHEYIAYGPSLFTGGAGGGKSNLRRHIVENDLLEAIIAMPEKDFCNTGIGIYIWIVTNRKEKRRRGKVQLIDATAISTPLKKNLGEKNCETSAKDCDRIVKLLMDFKETPESKIFRNEEFGYWEVPVLRPKRDKEGKLVLKKVQVVLARARNEVEQIPLTYPGGIAAFYEREVKPYDDEAVFGEPVVGYELSFAKYFYKPVELRRTEAIAAEIAALEGETKGLLKEILG